jgi:tetratricopeptide (TPR) repeat protein
MAALAAFSLWSAAAAANCQLAQLASLPVEMHGLSPFVWTKLNGVKALFELDSGAFYSTMYRDAAVQYQLPINSVLGGSFSIVGLGGRENAHVATVKSFEFLGVAIPNVQFLVIDQNLGSNSVGLLGQNVLRVSDVEYDLADGIVRFFKPVGCDARPLAYWAVNTPYSSVELQYMDVAQPHLAAIATINGHRVTVWFDTGAGRSMLSLDAAKRAGIMPGSPGVTFLGLGGGIGPAPTRVWSAPVDAFQLGGEQVQHTHLLIGDLEPWRRIGDVGQVMPDMMLGADFFLSHRIYVAYSQRKLYFTYNGGPLFNLNLPQFASSAAKPAGAPPSSDAPTDADGFKRRGMAYASMREFDLALADLTRACDLAPGDAEDHYDRGVIYAEDGQLKSALQDYDTAITLQPDDIDAHLARAELLESHPDAAPQGAAAEVKSDVDAVSRLAPPAAILRLTLSDLYGKLGDYPAAIDQIDQWLRQHPLENDQAIGLSNRCWLRATANLDLHGALQDCNRALDLRPYASANVESLIRESLAPEDPDVLDSRGLVYLRLGNLTDAVRDYDSALHINSNIPTALYGRGLAELRLGEKEQGQSDLTAAEKLDSGIAKRFAGMGLAP